MKNRKTSSPVNPSNRGWRYNSLWLFAGLGLLILVFYANSFSAGLVFDSDPIIRQDTRLHALNLTNIEDILTRDYWWPSQESIVYRPLTTFSYLFNYAILGNGENAGGYHAVNFMLHWLNAWLVLLVIRKLSGRLDVAVLTACLFAIHPINTEAVTNIVGRADLLATLSVLLGGWCYLQASTDSTGKTRWLVAMGVTTCLGVLAKENAVMIVAFVVLYDFLWRWPGQLKKAFKTFAPDYVALIPGLALFLSLHEWMAHKTLIPGELFADNPLMGAATFQRLMTAMSVTGRYLELLAFPRVLSGDYSFNQIAIYGAANSSGTNVLAWASLTAVVLLIGAALWLRRYRLLSWGILFLFVMMLPTANIFIVIGTIMAERFMYLPSIGFCALAAMALCWLGETAAGMVTSNAQKTIAYCALPLLTTGALGVRTFYRNADWQTDLSLWKSTVDAVPGSFKAHMAYGDAIWADALEKGKPMEQVIDKVLEEKEIARSIVEPTPPIPIQFQNLWPYLHLGRYYRIKGEFLDAAGHHDEAMQLYRKSVDTLVKAESLDRFNNQRRREFQLRRGMPAEKIPDQGNAFVYQMLCLTYGKLEAWDKCETAGRYLEHIAPQQSLGYKMTGIAILNLHRDDEAAVHFIAEMLVDPANPNDNEWIGNLRLAYKRLGTEDAPVNAKGTLNTDSPLVRQQLDRARSMRDELMRQYPTLP